MVKRVERLLLGPVVKPFINLLQFMADILNPKYSLERTTPPYR